MGTQESHTQEDFIVRHVPNAAKDRIQAHTGRPCRILWQEQFELDGMPFFVILTSYSGPYCAFKVGWASLPYDPHDNRIGQCIEWAAKANNLQEIDAAFGDGLTEVIEIAEQAIDANEWVYETLKLHAEFILDGRFAPPERRQEAMYALDLVHALQTKHRCHGFVYVLQGGPYYKIGCTTNLDRRIKQISPALPFPVEIIHTIETEDMYQTEAYLHEKYASKRQNGEWFLLEPKDVIAIKDMSNV